MAGAMTGEAQVAILAPGRRLHLHHGPIDIIAEAFGDADEIRRAYAQAARRFETVLAELVAELPQLRSAVGDAPPAVEGAVARRMAAAVWLHRGVFVTPMAAVAGAVADEVLSALMAGRRLRRAYVNNGGDIAVHLDPGQSLAAGIVDDADRPALAADVVLRAERPSRGLATSGWRGRSQSLGIADAVTVLAANAAAADVAATLIANAVTADHPAIQRAPANSLRDDSDLGDRLVTVAVGFLPDWTVDGALANGAAAAETMLAEGLIAAAYLALQGRRLVVEPEAAVRAHG